MLPLSLKLWRIAAVVAGVILAAAGTLALAAKAVGVYHGSSPVRVMITALVLGGFLMIPQRSMFRSKAGAIWLGLSFLLAGLMTSGFVVMLWNTAIKQTIPHAFISVVVFWGIAVMNAFCAWRTWREQNRSNKTSEA
jgi:hypothetical protein